MKLITFSIPGGEPRPGLLQGDRVLPLPFADTLAAIRAGEDGIRVALASHDPGGAAPLPLAALRLHAPLRPSTLRDFYAFEQHVLAANRIREREIPAEWYQFPVFYFTNPNSIFGPGDEIRRPAYTQALDYELEIAAVIGRPGVNIRAEDADAYIFGFTIFNDWSARDVQRAEMKVGLGPAKGKDFASSLGPCLVTPDELAERAAGRPGVYDLTMTARVNGVERSHGCFKDIHYSFGELIARASQEAWLYPGDVLGSGTVGSGCLLELTGGQGPWLQPGDVVELEIEGIGVLQNIIRDTQRSTSNAER